MLVQNMNIFNRDNPFENGNKMATILLDSLDTERGVPTAKGKIGCLYEESIARKIVKRGLVIGMGNILPLDAQYIKQWLQSMSQPINESKPLLLH